MPELLLLTLSLAVAGCGVIDQLEEAAAGSSSSSADSDDSAPDPDPPPAPDPVPTPDPVPAPNPVPAPASVPDVDVELLSARMRVFVVGGTITASVEADWSATGAQDLQVDLEVLSSSTHRAWTPILWNQPPVYFAETTLAVTPGETRFDYRVVAHDADGNEWISNTFTVQ